MLFTWIPFYNNLHLYQFDTFTNIYKIFRLYIFLNLYIIISFNFSRLIGAFGKYYYLVLSATYS